MAAVCTASTALLQSQWRKSESVIAPVASLHILIKRHGHDVLAFGISAGDGAGVLRFVEFSESPSRVELP